MLTFHVTVQDYHSESGHFNISATDTHSLLRPETAESLFVMWRVTGDTRYQEWGWHIFRAIEQHAQTQWGGYASIKSVVSDVPVLEDKMESFFLAETLKYLFLLFEDNEVR